ERWTDLDRFRRFGDAVDHFVEGAAFDVQPGAGRAALPVVEEDRVRRAQRRNGRIDVAEDDVRRFAAQLERQFLEVPGGGMDDQSSDFRRPGEGDLIDAVVSGERRTG